MNLTTTPVLRMSSRSREADGGGDSLLRCSASPLPRRILLDTENHPSFEVVDSSVVGRRTRSQQARRAQEDDEWAAGGEEVLPIGPIPPAGVAPRGVSGGVAVADASSSIRGP